MPNGIKPLSALEQLQVWEGFVKDPRGVIPTGWAELDALLKRGGFAPGNFAILAGRTETRKTTVMMNLITNMLREGRAVGLISLDEATPNYVAKLASAMSGVPHEKLEEEWDTEAAQRVRAEYLRLADRFVLSMGHRPDFDHLSAWLDAATIGSGRPEIVFVDYISLLTRDKYAGQEVQRISRLVEHLQIWSNKEEVAVIAIHQVGRMDEGNSSHRYHGHTPLSLESLKFGGEEIADIVLGTYRPAKDPLGNMDRPQAEAYLGDRFNEERWLEATTRVARYQASTFLQLLKNRPGTRTDLKGIELKSLGESMKMRPMSESVNESMVRVSA